jgi:predicted ATPase/DNA-binding SARP family transcriptional activator
MGMLEVRLLGTFEVRHKKKPINISSRPAQSLFAYLILSAGTAHRREKLAGLLWPDSLEETARDNLRHALWRVRKALQSASSVSCLQANDLTVTFNASAEYWLDASELEKVSENASTDELIAVLSAYQGELLTGFYDEWVLLEREHLSSIFEHKMARLMSLLQDEKRWPDILDWAERWISLGQKPEPAYRALMSAHAVKGDMSKVAATFERCVKSLNELGIEPSEQTRGLYERLKAGKATLGTRTAVPESERLKESVSPRTNLPVPLTSFIGREKEVEEIIRSLGKNRLVTLAGSGGVGKTRLAIEAANRLLRKFKGGVWWVELAGLTDKTLVSQALAKALGLREIPNQSLNETLTNFLSSKQILLVLDNCEHLITACAQLADTFLSACPNLKILATSREALELTGEDVWHVPSLTLPDPGHISLINVLMQYAGTRLFIERATAIKSDFLLTERKARFVAQVCRRLDGIPLAIELAAARVKVLSLEQIATLLNDRFHLLTSGSRTALPRHQTLRAAIDWSYDLLSDKEPDLFRRLAVFAGGCTLEEAQAVCSGEAIEVAEVLDLLTHLVGKSLVVMQEQNGEARYQMLETVREYALEKFLELSEAGQVRNRHLDFFVQLAEQGEPELQGAQQAIWLERLEIEHDNLRAALDWSLTGGELEAGLRLAGALWLFWDVHGYHHEGRVWSNRMLAKCHGSAAAPSASARAKLLYVTGHLRQRQGDLERAREHYTASLAIYRQLKDEGQVAMLLRGLGELAQDEGDLTGAKNFYDQSVALFRRLGDMKGSSIALGHLGIVAILEGDYEQAAALCTETLASGRARGDSRTTAIALTTLGFVSWAKGKPAQAATQFAEALDLQATLTDKWVAQYSLMGMALVAFATRQLARAARLFGAAESLRESIGTPVPPSQRPHYDSLVAAVRAQLHEARFAKAWAEGRAMELEQAVQFALKNSRR